MKTVFIIDDHVAFRAGFRLMLELYPGMVVIGDSPGLSNLIPEMKIPPADLIFIDVHLRKINAFELTRVLHAIYPGTKITILTMFSEPDYVTIGKEAGADAVVLKSVINSTLGRLLQELFPGEFSVG